MSLCQLGILYEIINRKKVIIHKKRIKIHNIAVDLNKKACYYNYSDLF